MTGTLLKFLVAVGEPVRNLQPVLLLEAMKMENEILSPTDGVVLAIHASEGDTVNNGDLLISIG